MLIIVNCFWRLDFDWTSDCWVSYPRLYFDSLKDVIGKVWEEEKLRICLSHFRSFPDPRISCMLIIFICLPSSVISVEVTK